MSIASRSENVLKNIKESWQDPSIAKKYACAEAATRPFADIFLDKAFAPKKVQHSCAVNAFDFGCGTGAVIAGIYEKIPKEKWENVKVLGGDISESMLTYLRERGEDNGWPGLQTQIVDGANIQLEKEQFTHVFANFSIFFLPTRTLQTWFDLLQPGGFIGFTSWAALPWYRLVERAINNLPTPPPLPSIADLFSRVQQNNPWQDPSYVRQQLVEAGFQDVEVVQEKKNVASGTPTEYVENMLTMPLKMISGYWDEEKREETFNEVIGELRKVVIEEAGGEDEQCYVLLDGIVGVGWKPAKKAQ